MKQMKKTLMGFCFASALIITALMLRFTAGNVNSQTIISEGFENNTNTNTTIPPLITYVFPNKIPIKLAEYVWSVRDLTGTVEISVNNGPWVSAVVGMRVPFCTRITTGFQSKVVLERITYFCDRRKELAIDYVLISGLSNIHLGEDSLSYQKNRPKLVRGKKFFVKKPEVMSRFGVSTPRLTSAVKGTRFSLSHYQTSDKDTI